MFNNLVGNLLVSEKKVFGENDLIALGRIVSPRLYGFSPRTLSSTNL